MPSVERTFNVSYRHRIFFTDGVFNVANALLKDLLSDGAAHRRSRTLVVMDQGLSTADPQLRGAVQQYFAAHCGCMELVCPPLLVEGGERAKNTVLHVSEIHSQIEKHHIDRQSWVIAMGGGALLDVAGLAAATAHRGVRHIRIPSTTLSQADSGVGVKNGINAFGKKNFIGTFAPPTAVINDFELLRSLPERDRRAGYVEAIKVALIRDAEFFGWIEQNADALASFDAAAMRRLIYWSAELHVDHIATSGDPFELGSARPLDFGHWAAHKLEQLSDYSLRHGEAVAIGIALDTVYSRNIGLLDSTAMERIITLLEKLGFELFANELLNLDGTGQLPVLGGLDEFREHLGGELTVTILAGIGRGIEVHEMNQPKIQQAIYELEQRRNHRENNIVRTAP